MKYFTLLLALVLVGCASPSIPEQAIIGEKNATASCAVVNSPWGRGIVISVVLDKAVIISGSVVVGNDCSVTITAAPK
jgi:hypothetical protein